MQHEQYFWRTLREATRARLDADYNSAFDLYSDVLRIRPDHEDALYYLGSVSREMGRDDIARRSWEQLLAVNPLSSRAYLQLGMLSLCADKSDRAGLEAAIASFEAAHELNREESGALLRLAEVSLLLGNETDAAGYLDSVILLHQDNVEALFLRAYLSWSRNRSEEAEVEYRNYLKARSGDPASHSTGLGEGDTRSGSPLATVVRSCPALDGLLPAFVTDPSFEIPSTAEAAFAEP